MRILFLTSFYSGLKESVFTGQWDPSGMPAMYKLLEGLKKNQISFDYCFIDKNNTGTKQYNIDFFRNNKFYVLGCLPVNSLPKVVNKFFFKIIYLKKVFTFLKQIKVKEYDAVYLDRANVSAFIVIHYLFRVKGILRLHGIGLQYFKFKQKKAYFYKNLLNLFSYKLPFKYIIASRDGTPTDKFLKEFTNNSSEKAVFLNGVDDTDDIVKKSKPERNEILQFLFVGRLEKDKGIIEIIESFKNHKDKSKISLTIIGGGSLRNYVSESCLGQPHMEFLGTLSHKDVKKNYIDSDVFISFNHLGNISNVVLEAIKYNLLIITFEKDLSLERDVDSNNFLGNNVIYVKRDNAIPLLSNEISNLVNNESLLLNYKSRVQENLLNKIKSWEDRIEEEILNIRRILS